ncbi:MAG: glycosyltransferase family 39 protein [Anaerolineae bacterium]|nr:glycosyltransferase family 39 protein [Anaerolineae bacterium]
MGNRQHLERWALAVLFLLAFVPRVVYPVSRPLQWYFRSAQFFQAILQGDLADTLFSEHPGVTVMWLSGTALWGWYGVQSLFGLNPPTPLETEGYAFADRVAVGVVPLALVVALGIVWGWYLLRRLFGARPFGRRMAWIAAVLWAIDPFYLANSKALHLDATLSTLMMLSALWMLVYLRERRWRQLILSAVLGGLAISTKISAIFLAPFFGFVLLVHASRITHQRPLRSLFSYLLFRLVIWVLIAIAVFTALWPAFWVRPGDSLEFMIKEGILLHTGDVRNQPLFYRGTLGVQDPGPGFYLDAILFGTTFLTLPFALVGMLALWRWEQEERVSLLLLVDFACFFFVQMSLGGWKDSRYMLPVLLALDVLAACGLTWWVGRLPVGFFGRIIAGAGLLAAQAIIVFSHHPYYGTHYNALAGDSKAVVRVFPLAEWGEGLDLAGQYVDAQPGAENFIVGTQFLANEMLAQHVRAPVYEVDQVKDDADYLVFGVQYTMRGKNYDRWGKQWEQTYKFREPEFVVSFGGIPYAWVHRPVTEPVVPKKMDAELGGTIRLVGYRLAQEEVLPGDAVVLTLYWRAEQAVESDYTVFVHLQGTDGGLVAQKDNPPARGTQPTSGWEPGVLVEDPYEIQLPTNAAFGEYVLSAGMYDPMTAERLEAVAADGGRLPEDRVTLAGVSVQPAVEWWRWVLSGAWLVLVVAGAVWAWLGRRG